MPWGAPSSGTSVEAPSEASFARAVGAGAGTEARKLGGKANGSKTCAICDQPTQKARYCKEHLRGYECIYRDATTEEARANGNLAEFERIFGDAKQRKSGDIPMEAVAHQIVHDFCALYPGGQKPKGVKRGKVVWSKYTHSQGYTAEQNEMEADRWMDQELFAGLMKSARGWNAQRANEFWDEQWQRKVFPQDANGPPWSKERMQIPSNIVGDDRSERKAGEYESKSVVTSSKEAKLRREEKQAILSECARGFAISLVPVESVSLS